MAWNFRRSIHIGKYLRLNLSKSGIGYSGGITGIRYGVDSQGRKYRYLSIPRTGIYNRQYYGRIAHRSHTAMLLWIVLVIAIVRMLVAL